MRRKDKQVTGINEIKEIIKSCKTCHLAMIDEGIPYIVPLSFGYELSEKTLTLYFHSAAEGRKIDILNQNNNVCFEMCIEGEPIYAAQTPCESGYYYASIIGNGNVEFIEDEKEKCDALTRLMRHQANVDEAFSPEQTAGVSVFKVVSDDFTGKRKPKSV